jgi:hypothetical protein
MREVLGRLFSRCRRGDSWQSDYFERRMPPLDLTVGRHVAEEPGAAQV